MGIPHYLTFLLRELFAGQDVILRIGHETTDWYKIENGIHQGCILSHCLFNLYAEHIMQNAGLDKAQAGIKFAKNITITSDTQMTPLLW